MSQPRRDAAKTDKDDGGALGQSSITLSLSTRSATRNEEPSYHDVAVPLAPAQQALGHRAHRHRITRPDLPGPPLPAHPAPGDHKGTLGKEVSFDCDMIGLVAVYGRIDALEMDVHAVLWAPCPEDSYGGNQQVKRRGRPEAGQAEHQCTHTLLAGHQLLRASSYPMLRA